MDKTRPAGSYSSEEAAQLIREATELSSRTHADALSPEDVKKMAAELGVDEDSVQRAMEAKAERERLRGDFQQNRKKEITKLRSHVVSYAVIVLALTALNFVIGGGWWSEYVAIGWGIGLAMHVFKVLRLIVHDAEGPTT